MDNIIRLIGNQYLGVITTYRDLSKLVYDWNLRNRTLFKPLKLEFLDETLRDGLQAVSVRHPTLEEKFEVIELMEELGINSVNLGMAFASTKFKQDVQGLARLISEKGLKIQANSPARMIPADVDLIVDISHKSEIPIEICTFIATSPIRVLVEGWKLEKIIKDVEKTISRAIDQSVEEVMFVTEDTTRADPKSLERLFTAAISSGARRIALCDTVGHANPHGTREIVKFTKEIITDLGEKDVEIDWHGHRDRGLALANALTAVEAGVTRIHATALGIGERSGNLAMEILLINAKLLGWIENKLYSLVDYSRKVSEVTQVTIPPSMPVIGKDAFRTQTGIHASAIIKAKRLGDTWLEDRVYSSIPAEWIGRNQHIEIGPNSGKSNVIWWFVHHQLTYNRELVGQILDEAKKQQHILSDEEILKIIRDYGTLPDFPET